MSVPHELLNSFGPETTPYEQLHQQPLENYDTQVHERKPEKSRGEAPDGEPKRKKILRLPVLVFWAVAALLSLVILGVGVGVGVAFGTRRGSNGSGSSPGTPSTSTSPTPTSTSTAPDVIATSGTHGVAANSCTFLAPRTHSTADGTSFIQHCSIDWPHGTDAADGNGQVADVFESTVYTFEKCIELCIQYNRGGDSVKAPCRAITYISNLTYAFEVKGSGGNCWLKNKQGIDSQRDTYFASAAIASV